MAELGYNAGVWRTGLVGALAVRYQHPEIVFTVPGIVLATILSPSRFVARELIPLMQPGHG